jgi:hypothetical protein
MNDFLQNLRRQKDKRYNKNRRSYDDNQYNSQDSRSLHNRKKPNRPNYDNHQHNQVSDALNSVKNQLDTIVSFQKRQTIAQENRLKIEERIAAALELIISSGVFSKNEACEPQSVEDEEKPFVKTNDEEIIEASPYLEDKTGDIHEIFVDEEIKMTDNSPIKEAAYDEENDDEVHEGARDYDRESVLGLIKEMRDKDLSYANIAYELETMGIPTFSGKGKWRGQTVHRLFQQVN